MTGRPKGIPKTGGRKKGTPNKINALLKDEILAAADAAHPEGRVGYLTSQAKENPAAFMTLLGKVLPMTVSSDPENPLVPPVVNINLLPVAGFSEDSDGPTPREGG